MQHLSYRTSVIVSVLLIASFLFALPFASLHAATTSKGFVKGVATTDVRAAYQEAATTGKKVRILIVPGHESDYGGAQYNGYYERELSISISEKIAAELRTDPNLDVLVARGTEGWNGDLESYFDRSMSSIKKFVDKQKKAMKKLQKKGKIKENEDQASHNAAPTDVALRLYGITKWANENDVDLMIHVHLNDSGGHTDTTPGTYTGLTVYVPDSQYSNADASRDAGEAVFKRLNLFNATSTLPIEDKGVVEDQDLIALGAYNTSEVPSILVEYSYIYEPKNVNETMRNAVYQDQGYQTALGVKDFLGATTAPKYETRALPYTWTSDIAATSTATTSTAVSSTAMYSLQAALRLQGVYPAVPSTLINCPIDGVMRDCVTDALARFQTQKGIKVTGRLDAATRNALNALYSLVPVVQTDTPAPTPVASTGTKSPTTGACVAFGASLELNSTDAATKGAVSRLQKILAQDKTIYPEGKVTGVFGPATDKAVKAFQVKNSIAKAGSAGYGVVGPTTGKALLATCR